MNVENDVIYLRGEEIVHDNGNNGEALNSDIVDVEAVLINLDNFYKVEVDFLGEHIVNIVIDDNKVQMSIEVVDSNEVKVLVVLKNVNG